MNNASKYTIIDLPTRLKVARNQAVFGNYLEALKHYKLCLTLIQERIAEISEPFLKDKWKVVEAEIKVEITHCNYLLELCNSFKTTPFEKPRNTEERHVMRSDLVTDLPASNKQQRPERFEKQPFSYLENNKQQQSENIVNLIGGVAKSPVITSVSKNPNGGSIKQQGPNLVQPLERGAKPKSMLILSNKDSNQIKSIFEDEGTGTESTSDLTVMIGQMKNDNKGNNDKPIQSKLSAKQIEMDDTFSMLINSFDKQGNNNIDFSRDDNFVARQQRGNPPAQEKKEDPMVWKPIERPVNDSRGAPRNVQPTKQQPCKP